MVQSQYSLVLSTHMSYIAFEMGSLLTNNVDSGTMAYDVCPVLINRFGMDASLMGAT